MIFLCPTYILSINDAIKPTDVYFHICISVDPQNPGFSQNHLRFDYFSN